MVDDTQPSTIEWEIAMPATGGTPERDPRKARFRWKRGDAVIKTQDFTQEDLEAQIRRFERAGEAVPTAFHEALQAFAEG